MTKKITRRRMPSGKYRMVVKRKKPTAAKCAGCGKQLHGVPRLYPNQMKKLPKTKKRPQRAYGGYLCGSCVRELFKAEARKV
jgi:large subunit ribosomal protein L34e